MSEIKWEDSGQSMDIYKKDVTESKAPERKVSNDIIMKVDVTCRTNGDMPRSKIEYHRDLFCLFNNLNYLLNVLSS